MKTTGLSRGFTAVELLVVLALAAILATLGASSFTEQLARRRLEGVATDLTTDLQYARTQAVSSRDSVRLRTTGGGTTYIIDNTAGTITYKTVNLPGGVTVTDSVTVTYDQLRGMAASAAQLALASNRTAATMRVDVSLMGRVSLCSPSGSLKGYTTC